MATTTKAKEAAQETENFVTEMSDQAFKNWEKAFRSGIKLQEQTAQWWNESLNTFSVAQDWQKRVLQMTSLASGMIPQAQRQMEQAIELAGKNTRTASELYQKVMDAAQTPLVPEKDSKWMDFWTASVRAARSNTEALMEMNNQAVSAWMQFMRKSEAVESRARA